MKEAVYNERTGEFDFEHDLSSKREERGGKTTYGYWTKCIIYDKEDMQLLGKPDAYSTPQFYETPDGEKHQLHSSFSYRMDSDRKKSAKEPWFGKVCVFKDGTIYDMEQDKEHYIAFHHDWSSFDEFGAVDESYYVLKSNGKTLLRAWRNIVPTYANGRLVSVSVGRDEYSVEQLELRQTLKETVEKLVDLGESTEKIDKMVTEAAKNNLFKTKKKHISPICLFR